MGSVSSTDGIEGEVIFDTEKRQDASKAVVASAQKGEESFYRCSNSQGMGKAENGDDGLKGRGAQVWCYSQLVRMRGC